MAKQRTTYNGWGEFGGYMVSTLLLLWLRRKGGNSGSDSDNKPAKYTDSNVNQIGGTIPVVLGRAMIKSPLVSFYGDYRADIYTEEYGMHSNLDIKSVLWPMIISLIVTWAMPTEHKVTVTTPDGPGTGVAIDIDNGAKNAAMMNAVCSFLMWLLMSLLNKHMGRTTIQKGFKYYLGWQNIICWTGEHCGIKKIWMNVYDSNAEDSTEQGIWGSNNISWKSQNPKGIVAHIDKPDMFGGVDEQGGFVGDIRFYFGTHEQGRDSWMADQMTKSENIPTNLKGLTPVYPMFMTSVIPTAYIGKQCVIPEMWFEVVNYPQNLKDKYKYDLQGIYNDSLTDKADKLLDFINKQPSIVIDTISKYIKDYTTSLTDYKNKASVSNLCLQLYNNAKDDYKNCQDLYQKNPTDTNKKNLNEAIKKLQDSESKYTKAQDDTNIEFSKLKDSFTSLKNNWPASEKDEFTNRSNNFNKLLTNGVWHLGRLNDDVNAAEAIYEILTNSFWGCHYVEDRINVNSLLKVGITTEEEGFGISCQINKIDKAGVYIKKILEHINGVCYDDPITGKLTFKLIRNDYTIEKLPVFSTSNCESMEFTRLDWSETSSAVQASFTDASDKYNTNSFTYNDPANVKITDNYKEEQIDGEYCTTADTVRVFAQTQLLSLGYPLMAVNIKSNRIAYNTTIGDPINVNWKPYGITQQIFRVTDIDYATLTEGKISITAIEDVFSFDKVKYEYGEIPQWTNPVKPPKEINPFIFIEMPYELTISLDTYIYAFAAQTNSYNEYWNIWRFVSPNYVKTVQSSQFPAVLRMTYGTDKIFGEDDGFVCDAVDLNSSSILDLKIKSINDDPHTYNNKSSLNLLLIEDEIISYDSIIKMPNGQYTFKNVIRGVYDTLPDVHPAYSNVFVLDSGLNISGIKPCVYSGQISSESLEITASTSTDEIPFDIAKVKSLTTVRRSEMPTIMGDLKFGADRGTFTAYKYNWPATTIFSYNILFQYNNRNKFNNYGIISQIDKDTPILMNDDIQNVIEVKTVDKTFKIYSETTNNNVMLIEWSEFCKNMDKFLRSINNVSLTIYTFNKIKNLYSYSHYDETFIYYVPKLVGIVDIGTETDDVKIKEKIQEYADSISMEAVVSIPESSVNPVITYPYEECNLVFAGAVASSGANESDLVQGQDGKYYQIADIAYKINGLNDNNYASIQKVSIKEYFVFSSRITTHDNNTTVSYIKGVYGWYKFTLKES